MSCGASKRSVLLELASPFVVEIWCRPAETVGGHCLLLLDTMESTCLRCFCVQPSWFDSQEPGSQAQVYRGSRPSSADGRREERKIVLSFLSVLSDPESPQTSERFSEESSCLFTSRGAILGALETRRQIQDTPEGLELPFSPGMSWNVLECPGLSWRSWSGRKDAAAAAASLLLRHRFFRCPETQSRPGRMDRFPSSALVPSGVLIACVTNALFTSSLARCCSLAAGATVEMPCLFWLASPGLI